MPPATRKNTRIKKKKIIRTAQNKVNVKSKAPVSVKKKYKKTHPLKTWWAEKKKKSAVDSAKNREVQVCLERLECPKKVAESVETPPQCESFVTDIKEEVNIDDVYVENEETERQVGFLPSEFLPGPKGQLLYYDGCGFYYEQTLEDNSQRWLQCIYEGCEVQAQMDLYEGAPIILTENVKHSHKPNTSRRNRMWFLHHLTTRSKTEDTSFSEIFRQEAAKNPVGASYFTFEKIEKHLAKKNLSETRELNSVDYPVDGAVDDFNPQFLQPESPDKLNKTRERPKGLLKRSVSLENSESKRRKTSTLSQNFCENPTDPEIGELQCHSVFEAKQQLSKNLSPSDKHSTSHTSQVSVSRSLLKSLPQKKATSTAQDTPTPMVVLCNSLRQTPTKDEIPARCIPSESSLMKEVTPLRKKTNQRKQISDQMGEFTSFQVLPTLPRAQSSAPRTRVRPDVYPVTYYVPISTDVPAMKRVHALVNQNPKQCNTSSTHPVGSRSLNSVTGSIAQPFPPPAAEPIVSPAAQAVSPSAAQHVLSPAVQLALLPVSKPSTGSKLKTISVPILSSLQKVEGSEMVPSLLGDAWLYYDLKGRYYVSQGVCKNKRFLICAHPMCSVRAWMRLITGSAIRPLSTHDHPPCSPLHYTRLWFTYHFRSTIQSGAFAALTSFENLYVQEIKKDPVGGSVTPFRELVKILQASGYTKSNIKKPGIKENYTSEKPAEFIPSSSFGGDAQFYDGDGFYYVMEKYDEKHKTPVLRCATSLRCPGQATKSNNLRSPITVTINHNHQPNPGLRDIYLFVDTLKTRVRDETQTSVCDIYSQEAIKYPSAAETLNEKSVKSKLQQIRSLLCSTDNLELNTNLENDDSLQKNSACAEILQGRLTPVYHDGKGFYFVETFTNKSYRFLMCCDPNCLTQAQMCLLEQDSIHPLPNSEPHNHRADPYRKQLFQMMQIHKLFVDVSSPVNFNYEQEAEKYPIVAAQISKRRFLEMATKTRLPRGEREDIECPEIWESDRVVERLPNFKSRDWIYHDGRGYYYYSHQYDKTRRSLFLVCCEKECGATASVSLEKLPEIVTRQAGCLLHNHRPDPVKAELLGFLHNVMTRIQRENHYLPMEILQQEARRAFTFGFDVLSKLPEDKCKEIMTQLTVYTFFQELQPDFLGFKADECTTERSCVFWSQEPKQRVYSLVRQGFYFTEVNTSQFHDNRYLKCLMPLCKAVGITIGSAQHSIRVPVWSPRHNHPPDFEYKEQLAFINRLRDKAFSNVLPIDDIYRQEYCQYKLDRGNVSVRLGGINEANLKNMMYKVRKTKNLEISDEEEPFSFFNADEEFKLPSKVKSDEFYSHFEELENLFYEGINKKTVSDIDEPDHMWFEGIQSNSKEKETPRSKCSEKIKELQDSNVAEQPPGRNSVENEIPKPSQVKNLQLNHSDQLEELQIIGAMKDLPGKCAVNLLKEGSVEKLHQENTVEEQLQETSSLKAKNIKTYKSSWLKQQNNSVIPEKIPYLVDHVMYFDPRGYYFLPTTVNEKKILHLHCTNPKCRVWAWISQKVDNAPLIMTDSTITHNHEPDFEQRNKLLLEHRIIQQALSNKDIPLEDIWRTEAARDPDTAKHLSYPVKVRLSKYRFQHFKRKDALEKAVSEKEEAKPTTVVLDKEPSRCEFYGCKSIYMPPNNVTSKPYIHFFKFPLSKTAVCLRWLKNCNNNELFSLPIENLKEKWVCELHFKDYCFTNCLRNTLKINAVPTVPNCSITETKIPHDIKSPLANQDLAKSMSRTSYSGQKNHQNLSKLSCLTFESRISPMSTFQKLKLIKKVNKLKRAKFLRLNMKTNCQAVKEFQDIKKYEEKTPPTLTHQSSRIDEKVTILKTKTLRKCSFAGCEVTSLNSPNIPMFKFPVKRPQVCSEWVKNCANEQLLSLATSVLGERKVCQKHFEERDFTNYLHNHLKLHAVPKWISCDRSSSLDSPGETCEQTKIQTYSKTSPIEDRKLNPKCIFSLKEKLIERSKMLYRVRQKLLAQRKVHISRQLPQFERLEQKPKIGPKFVVAAKRVEEDTESDEANYVIESLGEDYTDYVTIENTEHRSDSQPKGTTHQCLDCGNWFSSGAVLSQHIKERHSQKQQTGYTCKLCDRVFVRKYHLVSHVNIAHTQPAQQTSDPLKKLPPKSQRFSMVAPTSSHEDEISQDQKVKSERVPSFRANGVVFYDGKGYYYTTNLIKTHKRYLRCVDRTCRGRAMMDNYEGAPIVSTNTPHSHQPNSKRQKYYRFLKRCCDRAVTEKRPVHDIYKQEADKDPDAAPPSLRNTILSRMVMARNSCLRTKAAMKEYLPCDDPQISKETSENNLVGSEDSELSSS